MRADAHAEILRALEAVAELPYDDEPVDQLAHALQCAALARDAGSPSTVVVAALLHDIGRSPVVLDDLRVSGGEHGALAARWLGPRVGQRIAWLARQHVTAKRYLVAVEPDYLLTTASVSSLRAQGGPMTPGDVLRFREHPWWVEAVALRRWDDLGKEPDRQVPGLTAYEPDLRAAVVERRSNDSAR